MKVNKQKFIESVEYLKEINSHKVDDLDLSEFTKKDLTEELEEFKMTGLDNKDFVKVILSISDVNIFCSNCYQWEWKLVKCCVISFHS